MELPKNSSSSNSKSRESQDRCERWRLPPDLAEHGRDIFWTILCTVASVLACAGWYAKVGELIIDLPPKLIESNASYVSWSALFMLIVNGIVPMVAFICCSLFCPKKIGHHGKFIVYFLTVVAAVITRYFVPHNTDALMALTGHTLYLHALGQVLRFSSDVSVWDMLLGALMQVLVYTAPGGQTSAPLIAVLGLCGFVISSNYIIGFVILLLPLQL